MHCFLEQQDFFQKQAWQRGEWSGGVGEGKHRLLTEGKVFWKKILLWFGTRRFGAVAFCWEIINWLISSPVPPYPYPYRHIKPGSQKVGGMYKHQLSKGNYSLIWLAPEVLLLTSTLINGGRKEKTYKIEVEERNVKWGARNLEAEMSEHWLLAWERWDWLCRAGNVHGILAA